MSDTLWPADPGPAGGPRIWFTQVPERKTVKDRIHLDLNAELARPPSWPG